MDNPEPGPLPSPRDDSADPAASPDGDPGEDSNSFNSLRDDITALVDDARTYAEAEIAFQKTRAGLASRKTARALALLVLALVLLHIALIALAVGAVIALAPLVTIWGAIAIVVGVLLAGVATLVWAARGNGKAVAAMFGSEDGA
ncbi:MAG: phage holin family protein [Alphaproteobacteria bacterium]|nr:phage holin family protein [Alphaproteobacteria bacterium]